MASWFDMNMPDAGGMTGQPVAIDTGTGGPQRPPPPGQRPGGQWSSDGQLYYPPMPQAPPGMAIPQVMPHPVNASGQPDYSGDTPIPSGGGMTAPTAGMAPSGPVGSSAAGGAPAGNLQDPAAWSALVQNPQQLDSWIASQAPWMPPDLRQYYAGVIQKQPGATPQEQAGSAQYYINKFAQDPKNPSGGGATAGGAIGAGTGSPGMLNIPGIDPGYAFQVGEAQKAIERSAASKGTLLTGGTLKGLANYIGGDLASSAYQGAFGRNLSLASLGENAAAGQGSNNSSYANNAANTITSGANAQGAAGIAQGNIIGNAANNFGSLYALNQMNKPPNSSGYLAPGTYNYPDPGQ